MSKPFSIIALLIMLGVAALQIALLVLGTPIVVNGVQVPPVASIVALILALVLIWGLWREIFSNGPAAEADAERTTRSRGAREITRKPPPVWQMNGQRLPADYFMFASRGVSVKSIKAAAEKYDRIMVGFDSGAIPEASLKAARDAGAELELYIEGPGGPTGNTWSPDERARVRRAAAKVGIHTGESDWMEEWDKWGWKAFAFLQLEEYLGEGYTAAEIDNLGRVLGENNKPLIAFFKEYGERCLAGHLPRLIMKNISPEQLQAVAAAVKDGELPRAMFAEFHIAEKGAGYSLKKQDGLSSQIAVRTVPSNDTFNYDAFGEYGLAKEFAKLMPPPAPPVVTAAPQPTVQAPQVPQAPGTQAPAAPPAPAVSPAAPVFPAPVTPAAAPPAAEAVVASAGANAPGGKPG